MSFLKLENKKIMVTGASSGIGRAVAKVLASEGVKIVLCGRNKKELENTRASLENPSLHQIISFDATDYARYTAVFDEIIDDGIKLDGLVHCAGIMKVVPIRAFNQKIIDELLDINLKSYLMLATMFARKKYIESGAMVGISAINAHNPQMGMTIYASAKAAIESATKTMALEFARSGKRINCVIPGPIDTPMIADIKDETLTQISEKCLLSIGQPEDVANTIAFLLSEASGYITGRAYYVDGGSLGQ